MGDKKFTYKNAAIYESLITKQPVSWNFFDEVWQNFSSTKLHTLGKESLKSVYRRRAQQLRDEYDYLILHYSGGSDSHEILMSFLENNIKLDEIFVQMALSVKEKAHKPNTIDTSGSNLPSEWDFVIKPVLENLKLTHPEIKITVCDYLKDYDKKFNLLLNEDIYLNNFHHNTTIELIRSHFGVSDSIFSLVEKEKKVAEIFGIDKPSLVIKENKFFLFFSDVPVCSVHPTRAQKFGVTLEPFYWTPKMPEICFEQAIILLNFFQLNPDLRHLIDLKMFTPLDSNMMNRLHALRKIYYDTIYHYFNPNTFQVDKPLMYSNHGMSRSKIYVDRPEFQFYFKKIDFYINSFVKEFGADNFTNSNTLFRKHYFSKAFFIGEFDNA